MKTLSLALLAAGSLAAASGCDPGAKATKSGSAQEEERMSKEYESCSSTLDCRDGLRCVEGACRDTAVAVKGDYYAAVGRRALEAGDDDAAVSALRKAEAEYKAEELEAPPEILCSLGRALAAQPTDQMRAEEAASKLHRCLNLVPPESRLSEQALSYLALLDEAGLDPVHLASAETADRYLTKAPKKPPIEALTIKVEADDENNSSAFEKFVELLGSEETKQEISPCWKAYWEATREEELKVELPFKHVNRYDEYRDIEYATIEVDDFEAPSNGDVAKAAKCILEKVAPRGKKLARKIGSWSRWSATFTLTVGPS